MVGRSITRDDRTARGLSGRAASRRQERAGTSDEQVVTDAGQQAAAKARRKPKAQANFTDPDSRIMKNSSDGAYM
ncbi:hypothetical protein P3T26_001262 [Streptomyces sp. MAA16]|nr:hypothetical protein [Streptomyces sp. MAA16]